MIKNIHSHFSSSHPLRILCLGAHSDDIEIGCGGTILRLKAENQNLEVTWIVFSALDKRCEEARKGAESFLAGIDHKNVILLDYRDGFFPYAGAQIKNYFENLKAQVSPDIIFTHHRNDLHQDHRLLCELTWNTFRNHLILEYEIPKYDGDLGNPNFFINLDREICMRKIQYIQECFISQSGRQWFDSETFLALLRLRGVESNSESRYAEAFHCRKISF